MSSVTTGRKNCPYQNGYRATVFLRSFMMNLQHLGKFDMKKEDMKSHHTYG